MSHNCYEVQRDGKSKLQGHIVGFFEKGDDCTQAFIY